MILICVTICEFYVSVTRELFVSDCYKNNKLSLYFTLQDCGNKCIFTILKFMNYIELIKNMLFAHSTNILKRQNNHLDYFSWNLPYPHLKPLILYNINGLAIWPVFSDITHITKIISHFGQDDPVSVRILPNFELLVK